MSYYLEINAIKNTGSQCLFSRVAGAKFCRE